MNEAFHQPLKPRIIRLLSGHWAYIADDEFALFPTWREAIRYALMSSPACIQCGSDEGLHLCDERDITEEHSYLMETTE